MNAFALATQLYYSATNGEDGTMSATDEELPTSGYYVGGEFESLVFKNVGEVDRGELAWWIGNNSARWYGVWVDQEDGRVYFDGVTHMLYRGTAIDMAILRKEIAIWDIAAGEEIRVVPTQ